MTEQEAEKLVRAHARVIGAEVLTTKPSYKIRIILPKHLQFQSTGRAYWRQVEDFMFWTQAYNRLPAITLYD